MTNYCVGCDDIDGKESSYIKDVITVLEQGGNTCENLGIGPNVVQSNGASNGTGKVGVFIVGGSDLGTYWDMAQPYCKYSYVWFAFASWTASTWITCDALKSTPLVRAHDDNFSSQGSISSWIGKTAKEFFDAHKDKMYYVCGQSATELGEKILHGGGGDDDKQGSSSTTYAEVIKELISYWDGEVECRIEGDTVYINKINDPSSSDLRLVEGLNIVADSLNITDINPGTVNTLIVSSNVCDDIILKDEHLIARFGEVKKEVEATKKVTVTKTTTTTTSTDSSSDSSSDSTEEGGGESTEESSSTGDSSTDESSTSTKTTTSTEEVPVKTEEEAINFANVEWAKIRRDDGHIIECKVIPDSKWKQGKWVKVYIPSYNEDSFMYITKVSNTDTATESWTTNITLKDYPPSFGEYKEQESNSGDESTEEETEGNENTEETEEDEGGE